MFIFNYQEPNPWSVVALLSLVCKTVQEIQAIIHCLSQSTSCLIHDILECFYCLASVFYYLESQHRIGSGYVWYIKSCDYMYMYTLKPVLSGLYMYMNIGSGTSQLDWLWGRFCLPGLTIWRKVFLIKKFSSKSFACMRKQLILSSCIKRQWKPCWKCLVK